MAKQRRINIISAILMIVLIVGVLVACEKIDFKVDFVVDGEVYATVNTSGKEVIKIPDNPTKDGYVFDGWYWDNDVWSKPFTANSLLDEPLSSNMAVYAKWIEQSLNNVEYNVIFNSLGGSSVELQRIQYGRCAERPANPTKVGALFAGWFKDPDYLREWDFGRDKVYSETILYAKWVKDISQVSKYTVTFNSNGGSEVQSYFDVTEGSTIVAPENPTKYAYEFVAWYTDNSFATEWTFEVDKVYGDITLYAKWKQVSATLLSIQGAEINGYDVFLCVEKDVTQVAMAPITKISSDSTWRLYRDVMGTEEIPTKYATSKKGTLENGNNVFYIVVSSLDGSNVNTYTLTVHRSYEVSVTYYNTSDDSVLYTDKAFTGHEYNIKQEANDLMKNRIGYTLVGWEQNDAAYQPHVIYEPIQLYSSLSYTDEALKNFKITSTSTECVVSGVRDNTIKELFIPEYVTSVKSGALTSCYDIEKATIPVQYISVVPKNALKTVIITGAGEIGSNAFSQCNTLVDVTISDKVTSIGNNAFSECSGLTSVLIGKGITSIGDYAFYRCNNLHYNMYDNAQYLGNDENPYLVLIKASDKTISSCEIYSKTKFIYTIAFMDCINLTSITIPDSVTSIGSAAFSGCSGLTSITIPDSVTSIGDSALKGCSELTEITLPFIGASETASNGYDQVLGYIFGYTTSSKSKDVINQYNNGSKSYYYFIPTNLKSVTITGKKIPSYAFCNCSRLTSVTIGSNVTSVGSNAFYGCNGLTTVNWNTPANISAYLFENCTKLSTVNIGNNVSSISSYAFRDCSSLTKITIPDNVTSIGKGAFEGCGLTEITLPFVGASRTASNGYNQVFGYIFGYITYKNTLYSGSTRVTCQYYNYSGNDVIFYHYYIPSSLRSVRITGDIPYQAFNDYWGLESVTIGSGVKSIGDEAFLKCSGLTEIIFEGTSSEWYNLKKGTDWDYETGNYTVYCTNGEIKKQ